MKQAAHAQGYLTGVVSFFPRPKAVLAPHLPARYLTLPDERTALLQQLGVDISAILPFTREMAQLSAQEFVGQLVCHLHMRELWVGPDFALGRDRQGDIRALRQMGLEMGFDLEVVPPLMQGGKVVSSTRIRGLIEQGDVNTAAALLGRFPSVQGIVRPGDHRGRRLGFPTANIVLSRDMVLPAKGVYACFAHHDGKRWLAVTNVGSRPTFGHDPESIIEAYLLHFSGDLYGHSLKLDLVEFLRPEKRFDSVDSLVAQIARDAQRAQELLTHPHTYRGPIGEVIE